MPTWAWILVGLASGLVTLYILAVLTAFMVGIKAARDIVKDQDYNRLRRNELDI